MDWPTRSIRSRITWLLLGVKRRHQPARTVPVGGVLSASLTPTAWGALDLVEHLYSIERPEGRPPLLVLAATDRGGHLASAITCDSEDYQ